MITEYIALDLETTGLDPKKNKIIEIAAVHVKDGAVKERYQTLLNPGWRLPEKITELTGITEEELLDAPVIGEKLGEFLEFLQDRVIVGHSVLFDYSFLKRAAVNHGLVFEAKAIDTLKIARKYLADLPSRNLHALCLHYGIEHHAHRALADAEATHELLIRLWKQFYQEETAEDFLPQELHYQVKREGPIMKSQKERLLRMLEQHKINPEYDVARLTRNEASRIIDKIILEYGKS
ncbi:MAG: 3'-5' exonuclease [Lachnospiraceae bacterium]|nr:3'-5' exonuclease [Lachnospiraceae bacterium]